MLVSLPTTAFYLSSQVTVKSEGESFPLRYGKDVPVELWEIWPKVSAFVIEWSQTHHKM